MFYALSKDPSYWESKLNLFVALAPITRMKDTTSPFFKYGSKIIKPIDDAFDFAHIWSMLGGDSSIISKIVCGLIPKFCELAEGFLITHDPSLDDEARF